MAERALSQDISREISDLWWLWVLQAIAAVLFGVVAIFWPHLTLVTLVYLLAAFVIAIGVIETVRSLMVMRYRDTWWMSLIIGLGTLGVGVFLARHPRETFTTFILVVGITLIVWGVIDIAKAFLDRLLVPQRILSLIAGVAALGAGIIILLQPVAGGLAFVWVLGLFAIIYGITALAEAIAFHRDFRELKTVSTRR